MSTASLDPEVLTSPGAAIGTAAYMSLEQGRGEKIDARTDLFSFGAVLPEMASGRRAFGGARLALIFRAIQDETPKPAVELNPSLPLALEPVINKALEKDRELRYQVASEMRADLKRLKRDTDSRIPTENAGRIPSRLGRPQGAPVQRRGLIALGTVLVVLAAAGLAWLTSHHAAPRGELRYRRLTANSPNNPAIDPYIPPDGKDLAYSDQGGIHWQLIETGETHTVPSPKVWMLGGLHAGFLMGQIS